MQQSRRTLLLRAAGALGALQFPVFALAREPMRITYFDSIPPFSWADEQHVMHGMLVDVMQESLHNRLGLEVVHLGFPWARAQKMVKDGEADAYCSVPTPERRSYLEISEAPITTLHIRMFAQRGNPVVERLKRVKSIEQLKDFVIGAYNGDGWARGKLSAMQVDWGPNLDTVLRKLATGRSDVYIDSSEVGRQRIKALGLTSDLVELPQVLETQTYNLCIRKGSPYVSIIPEFDKVMRRMHTDGSLAAIYRKHGLQLGI